MKILTNIRFAQTAGIAQALISFLNFVKRNKRDVLEITGVNIIDQKKKSYRKRKEGNITIISAGIAVPKIKDVLRYSKTLSDVQRKYASVIDSYSETIRKEKPDLILVNGTYYMPWCLFVAAKRESIPVVLHYHGVLTKETQSFNLRCRKIFKRMEQSFDEKGLFYIFPSKITKRIVEEEIFGHKITKCSILSNSVPLYFFEKDGRKNKTNIGIISRWAAVKNMNFCRALAKYNDDKGGKFKINLITDIDKKSNCLKGLPKTVKIYSPRSNKKLAGFYQKMGVVISPSHFETYGNVAKEAIASGVPAIVNPNMGVSETFKKLGLKDWIIDFKSVKNIYCKIEDVIGNTVAGNIRSTIKRLYSPDQIFNKMIDILISAEQSVNGKTSNLRRLSKISE